MSVRQEQSRLRVGVVVPHIFIMRGILEHVIFSPGRLAISLCEELVRHDIDVTLFAPGKVATTVPVVTADMSCFEKELAGRGDTYMDLLKKHPFTFITLARQVQSEIIARAYHAANQDEIDLLHVWSNEEDTALPFAKLCRKPVVFSHHDPFNFLVKYKSVFPKYADLPWISFSKAQRQGMPEETNWLGTVHHGLSEDELRPVARPTRDYVAYMGRIIEPKGVHLAIEAVKKYNKTAEDPLTLKLAGKHYAEQAKDTYWRTRIEPELGERVEYVGHLKDAASKQAFLGNARGLIVPSLFHEPFGMVTIEALACDTPVIGLTNGATSELIRDGVEGYIVQGETDTDAVSGIVQAMQKLSAIQPGMCRSAFENRFTIERMACEYAALYYKVADS